MRCRKKIRERFKGKRYSCRLFMLSFGFAMLVLRLLSESVHM